MNKNTTEQTTCLEEKKTEISFRENVVKKLSQSDIANLTFETFALIGVILTFIFSFFIGFSIGGNPTAERSMEMLNLDGFTQGGFSYFLWEGYEVFFFGSEFNENTAITFFALVLNTLFYLFAVVMTGCLTIKSIHKYLKFFPAKGDGIALDGIKSWIFYALGATVLLAISSVSAGLINSATVVRLHMTLNAPTVTGLLLSGICLLVSVSGRFLSQGPLPFIRQYTSNCIFALITLTTAVIAFFLLGGTAFGLIVDQDSQIMYVGMNFLSALSMATMEHGFDIQADGVLGILLFGFGGLLVHFTLFCFLASTIQKTFCAFSNKNFRALTNFSVPSLVFAVLYILFSIIVSIYFEVFAVGHDVEEVKIMFWLPVVIFVLTAVCAVFAALAQKSFATQTGVQNGGTNPPAVAECIPTSQPNDETQAPATVQASGASADGTNGTDAASADET